MPSKSYMRRKLQAKKKWSRNAHAAKARKKAEQASAMEIVGTVTFDGPMFGGNHVMRCLFCDDYSDRHVMLEIDGAPFAPKTVAGVYRLIARRLCGRNKTTTPNRQNQP